MDYKSTLEKKGTVVINQQDSPLSLKEWSDLENMYDSLEYEQAKYGDTEEKASLKFFRVKKPSDRKIHSEEAYSILNSDKVRSFFKNKLNIPLEHELDRCQMHLFNKGDFVSKHIDSESCKDYEYSVSFVVNDQYEGGEFLVYGPKGMESHKEPSRSILVTRSTIPHEVKPVVKGQRKTAVCFFKNTN